MPVKQIEIAHSVAEVEKALDAANEQIDEDIIDWQMSATNRSRIGQDLSGERHIITAPTEEECSFTSLGDHGLRTGDVIRLEALGGHQGTFMVTSVTTNVMYMNSMQQTTQCVKISVDGTTVTLGKPVTVKRTVKLPTPTEAQITRFGGPEHFSLNLEGIL
jgi:hypothetical protein